MQRVFVLDKNRNPLMPCHPARARKLLGKGRASVFRRFPFTIILHDRDGGDTQETECRIDPGSKTTGVALVVKGKNGDRVVFALEISHRSERIRKALSDRRAVRRNRRNRKTRYRKPRFLNRTRPRGWLPPSLQSRVENIRTWAKRLAGCTPIRSFAVETVRFDMRKMVNPEISGVEYLQGELLGYEVREYVLEKWNRQCAYCGKTGVPLESEHIVPRSEGGSNRVSNLTLACVPCNREKGNRPVEEFLAKKPELLAKIKRFAKQPLKDAAAVNATRYAVGNTLKSFGFPVSFWSGGRTKYNRTKQGYKKEHWTDAACVGESGKAVFIPPGISPLRATAQCKGSRQMCRMDRFGFPRTSAKALKTVRGFRTGDIVKAVVTKGKKAGVHIGRVAVRASGSFNIKTASATVQGVSWRYCRILQRSDGYTYF